MSGSFGTILKITISTTLTAVTHMVDVTFPKQVKELADNTAHDAPSGYRTMIATGVRKLEAFTAKLEWDADDTTHAAVLTAFASDSPVNMSIEDANSTETVAFSAHIKSIGRVTPLSDVYTAEVEIEPTGAPTIT